jgi:ferredoxin-type protein NapH
MKLFGKKKRRRGIKKSKIQYFRYACLFSVIFFFVLVPYSNWYANNKIAFNQARLVGLAEGPVMEYLYLVLDSFYSLWEDPVTAATSNNGSLWAFTILGIPLSDPLGLIAELLNSVKFPIKYLIGGIIPFIVALTLGRVFCSWLCPMVVLFAITRKIRAFLIKMRMPLMDLKLEERTRACVFWIGLIMSHFFGAWVWHFILPYISFTHEIFSIVVFSSFTIGVYFLIAILVLDIGLIPGEFCRSVCPTGYLLASVGRFRLFKLKANKAACPPACSVCNKVCPIGLFPKEDKLYSCDLCMKCVDNCPKKHIKLTVNPIYKKIYEKISIRKPGIRVIPEEAKPISGIQQAKEVLNENV